MFTWYSSQRLPAVLQLSWVVGPTVCVTCVLTFICERLHGLCDLVGSVEGVSGLGEIPQAFNGHLIKHRTEQRDKITVIIIIIIIIYSQLKQQTEIKLLKHTWGKVHMAKDMSHKGKKRKMMITEKRHITELKNSFKTNVNKT